MAIAGIKKAAVTAFLALSSAGSDAALPPRLVARTRAPIKQWLANTMSISGKATMISRSGKPWEGARGRFKMTVGNDQTGSADLWVNVVYLSVDTEGDAATIIFERSGDHGLLNLYDADFRFGNNALAGIPTDAYVRRFFTPVDDSLVRQLLIDCAEFVHPDYRFGLPDCTFLTRWRWSVEEILDWTETSGAQMGMEIPGARMRDVIEDFFTPAAIPIIQFKKFMRGPDGKNIDKLHQRKGNFEIGNPPCAGDGSDTVPPQIICPDDIVVSGEDPKLCGVMYWVTVRDNCNVTLTQTAGIESGGNFPLGTTVNTFEAADQDGNVATCSFSATFSTTSNTFNATAACIE